MGRYLSDQNKVLGYHESGTYSTVMTGSTFWFGQVTDHTIDDAENKLENRYLGNKTRSVGEFVQGPRDVTGTISYHASDMRLPFWAIGSQVDAGAGNAKTHIATQIDTNVWQSAFTSGTGQISAPVSFTIEDSKQTAGTGANFIRTINGAVPNIVTITASQGEKVKVDVDYVGQTLAFSSGTTGSVTIGSITPYLWSDCGVVVSGNTLKTVKDISLEINNNIEAPHYLNGSRDISVPYPTNRDVTMSITLDLDSAEAKIIYEDLYKNNGAFNASFDLNSDVTAGSQHAAFFLSGAYVTAMENPSTSEGVTESTIEIKPKILFGSSWDAIKYNPL